MATVPDWVREIASEANAEFPADVPAARRAGWLRLRADERYSPAVAEALAELGFDQIVYDGRHQATHAAKYGRAAEGKAPDPELNGHCHAGANGYAGPPKSSSLGPAVADLYRRIYDKPWCNFRIGSIRKEDLPGIWDRCIAPQEAGVRHNKGIWHRLNKALTPGGPSVEAAIPADELDAILKGKTNKAKATAAA